MSASGRGAAAPHRGRIAGVQRRNGAMSAALACTLAACCFTPAAAEVPLCLIVAAPSAADALAVVALAPDAKRFALTYLHSVTRAPVVETYDVAADGFTQTSIAFTEHGPGLPTEAVNGERWERRDGRFVVTMHRTLATIRMRVHADQRPLLAAGGRRVELAQWGNRALELRAGGCPP